MKLTDYKLIGITGHAGVGKSTVGEYLEGLDDAIISIAFAHCLKRACSFLYSIPLESFYDKDLKEVKDHYWNQSPREIAQFFGTEVIRDNLGADFWIRSLEKDLSSLYKNYQCVVVEDVRFQNELDWVLSKGGTILHVGREGCNGEVGIPGHASEAELDYSEARSKEVYQVLYNDGTLEELYAKLEV